MTGVRVYTSKYSGEEIDSAIMSALMFNPQENGWTYISSNEAYPVSLGDLTTPGNYIVDYFSDGPEALAGHSPLNVSVYDDNGILTEFIIELNNVFYRFFDENAGTYQSQWRVKKTANSFYINEEPDIPDTDSIKISIDDNGNQIMYWWNGSTWKEITSPDVMRQSIYDPQNRATDFFKYTDELFQQMTSTSVGMVLDDTDITNRWPGVASCVRTDCLGNTVVAFKGISKIAFIDPMHNLDIRDLPVSMLNPQIGGYVGSEDMLPHYFIYDNANDSSLWFFDPSNDTWTERNLSLQYPSQFIDGSYVYPDNIDTISLLSNQVGSINIDASTSLIAKITTKANVVKYYELKIPARISSGVIYPIIIPPYITDKDLYFRLGMFWKQVFRRGNDKMTPVKTSATVEPEITIMSACESDYSMATEDGEMVISMAEIQWEWQDRNNAFTQIPKLVFRAHLSTAADGEYLVPDLETYVSEVDYYVAISEFREFYGDFSGFGITTTGKLDKIDVIYDWELGGYHIDINTVNQLDDPTMSWDGIVYEISSLLFFGRSNYVPSSTHLFESTEEQNVLDAVSAHLMNGDIHFTRHDRRMLGTKVSKDEATVKCNRITIENKQYIDSRINESIEQCNKVIDEYNELMRLFDEHVNDERRHTTPEEKEYWNNKADGDHEHNLDGRVKIDANQIVSGVLSIDRIPRGAKERITKVDTIEERNRLTIDDIQNGDRVAVKHSTANRENAYVVYTVVNQDLLAHPDPETGELILADDSAFHEDAAGTGVYIDWVNVENTPRTLAGFGIEDSYTRDETNAEIERRVAAQTAILEERYLSYDLEGMYNTIHDTNTETHIIEEELADAINIAEEVEIMDDLLLIQEERINQMAEDLSEANSIVDDLLVKFE